MVRCCTTAIPPPPPSRTGSATPSPACCNAECRAPAVFSDRPESNLKAEPKRGSPRPSATSGKERSARQPFSSLENAFAAMPRKVRASPNKGVLHRRQKSDRPRTDCAIAPSVHRLEPRNFFQRVAIPMRTALLEVESRCRPTTRPHRALGADRHAYARNKARCGFDVHRSSVASDAESGCGR